ncbi:hypothetical protein [Streptomyces sp. AGS-58]|uniref:hypothetical protein n=1 Tax=unclassified Streptomyces TaxID=2593676 RepID=UPI0035A355CC
MIDLYTGWDARFTALIAACYDTIPPRSIIPPGRPDLAVGTGVTLLGDAAHLMPPVGQGSAWCYTTAHCSASG